MTNEIDWASPPLDDPPVIGKTYLQRDGGVITLGHGNFCDRNGAWYNANCRHPKDLIREYAPPAPLKVWMNTHFEGPATLWQTKAEAQSYERIASMCTRNAVPVTITEGH